MKILHYVPCGTLFLVGIVRAISSQAPEPLLPATQEEKRSFYRELAAREPTMRTDAVAKFPDDPWSQDDAFHEAEWNFVKGRAGTTRVRMQDLLQSIDEGIREHWSSSEQPMRTTVPPCRPRRFYD